jgi:anthranilate phosphoribosyltransferase
MTAAAALVVGGVAKDLVEGAKLAGAAIDGGSAARKLEELVQITNS